MAAGGAHMRFYPHLLPSSPTFTRIRVDPGDAPRKTGDRSTHRTTNPDND